MKPAAFEMRCPRAVGEALELLAANPDARVIAGGQSLVPMMNLRVATPPMLIDINRVPDLGGIVREGDRIRIGRTVLAYSGDGEEPAALSGVDIVPATSSADEAEYSLTSTATGTLARAPPGCARASSSTRPRCRVV